MTNEQMYERGRLLSHASDEGNSPDVGLSVGLGDGLMLYAGEVPSDDHKGWSLVVYKNTGRNDVVTGIQNNFSVCEMLEQIAVSLKQKPVTMGRKTKATDPYEKALIDFRLEQLETALQGIIDWADFAIGNPDEYDSHGVRNLDGPAFDKARAVLGKLNKKL